MAETSDTFTVGDALPRLRSVSAHEGLQVSVIWASGSRAPRSETIDLAPAVLRFKLYAPLRGDMGLFRTVQVTDGGYAITWGGEGDIDMASTTIEDLAEQTMTSADFAMFVKRHDYTLDSVAAELGISRRQAAYYQKEKAVPRYIALACAHIDATRRAETKKMISNETVVGSR